MLLEILTVTRNAWQSPACSPLGAHVAAKLGGYWIKVHQIFIDVEGSPAVLTCTSLLQSFHPSVSVCVCLSVSLRISPEVDDDLYQSFVPVAYGSGRVVKSQGEWGNFGGFLPH